MRPAVAPAPGAGGIWLARPLLSFSKADLVAHCRAEGLPFFDDPTNSDEVYRRPQLRRLAASLAQEGKRPLKLVEIHREDIESLPALMGLMRADPHRFIVFCDDLSFDADDTSYKSLKAVLEGGIEGRPDNVIFYATSNRRHLLPRDMMENERSTAINPGEAVEEKVSLSDRFGLWLGFHKCSQDEYLAMVFGYAEHFGLDLGDRNQVRAEALEWATTRGSRAGRTAWQYIQDLAGRQGKTLDA